MCRGDRLRRVTAAVVGLVLASCTCERESPTRPLEVSEQAVTSAVEMAPTPLPLARFAADTGVVKYRISGPYDALEVLQFAQGGRVQRRELTWLGSPSEGRGASSAARKITFVVGDTVTSFDSETQAGTLATAVPRTALNVVGLDLPRLGESELLALGARKLGAREVANTRCEAFALERPPVEVCLHGGLALSATSGDGAQQISVVATEVKLDVEVHESVFDPPAELRLRELAGPEVASLGIFAGGRVPVIPRDVMEDVERRKMAVPLTTPPQGEANSP